MTMTTDRGIAPGTAPAPRATGAACRRTPKRSSSPASRIRVIRTAGCRPCLTPVRSS